MRWKLGVIALAGGVGMLVAGCGTSATDDDASGDVVAAAPPPEVTAAAPEPPPPPRRATITMGSPTEFAMVPEVPEVSAGRVKLDVTNDGAIEHEVVLIRTNRDSGDLPTDAEGAARERGAVRPHGSDAHAGDHAGVHYHAGKGGTITVDLKPGSYAVVCNLPGHYAAGMHANLKVV